MELKEIGIVCSEVKDFREVRHLTRGWTADTCMIKLKDQYKRGLGGLDGYSHLIILFWISQHRQWKMPKENHKPKDVKVFATRMPVRPNPIGLSVVELLDFSIDEGTIIIKGIDAIDGTPVLDIKPYLPHFDSYAEAKVPAWIEQHLKEHHHGDGNGHSHGPGHGDGQGHSQDEGHTQGHGHSHGHSQVQGHSQVHSQGHTHEHEPSHK